MPCVSVVAFGQECPGCGLTRSFAAMGHGDFESARALNPLGPVLLAAAIALLLVRVAKLFTHGFDRWHTVDLTIAAAVVVAMIARSVQFYLF